MFYMCRDSDGSVCPCRVPVIYHDQTGEISLGRNSKMDMFQHIMLECEGSIPLLGSAPDT